ncbi:MAG TPA: hypothetical protein VGN07_01560 [Steroidobacteraceae bacterium]|jgi:hypothetical protein
MTLEQLIELTQRTAEHRHSPWELGDCLDWNDPSEKQYVRMGCDFIVEPPTHPLDTGHERMRYIAACDPVLLLPLLQELQQLRQGLPAAGHPDLLAYHEAMLAAGVPQEALNVYDSNSYRRVGLRREYSEVLYATTQRDGHPDIHGEALLRALVAAFNAMLEQPKMGEGA